MKDYWVDPWLKKRVNAVDKADAMRGWSFYSRDFRGVTPKAELIARPRAATRQAQQLYSELRHNKRLGCGLFGSGLQPCDLAFRLMEMAITQCLERLVSKRE